MNEPPLVVVGAGFAGTAAAWAAVRAGAPVRVVDDRAGLSAIACGALDLEPWHEGAPESRDDAALRDATLAKLVEELGTLRLGRRRIATREGVVRPALGSDRALLDLEPLAGKRIAVADLGRDDWDARLVARALGASPWAERTRTAFFCVPVPALRAGYERRIAAHDFALLHDDPERRRSLARVLKEAEGGAAAWLLGPWLGIAEDAAHAIAELIGVPVGETTSPMGGAAGARFERSRDALFGALGVERVRARVLGVARRGERLVLTLDGEPGTPAELEAPSVVLATGGVGAGGILLSWAPGDGGKTFALGFEAPLALALHGERVESGGSLFGPGLESQGFGMLESVGVAADREGAPLGSDEAARGLYVAGDIVADRPRTALRALQDGIAAGSSAARFHAEASGAAVAARRPMG